MEPFNISDIFCIKDNILIGPKTGDLDEKTQNCINIGDLILQSFISNPDFIGQVDGETDEENTFQHMREKTIKCALWMQFWGVKPNDVIMICTNNQFEAYVPFLAALYIGAVVNPLDMYYNLEMIDSFIEQVKPVMIFVNETFYKRTREILTQLEILTGHSIPTIIAFRNKKRNVQTTNEDLLTLEEILNFNYDPFKIEHFSCTKVINMKSTSMILFTSGTTTFPVQVQIPHLAFMAPSNQQAPNMRKNDTALLYESLCYINGIFMTIQAILLHVKVIRIKAHFIAEKVCEIIKNYKVTWVYLETNMCNRLIKSCQLEKHEVPSLRTVVFGGSILDAEKIHHTFRILLPKTNILQIYSLTETGIIAYQRQPGKGGSCGYVSANVQLKIVAISPLKKGQLLGPEQYGEVYCISPYMLTAYSKYNSEHPEVISDWFKTGDMAYYDKDGDIYIVDRIDQMYRVNSLISPTLIENLLLSHNAVLEAIVIPIPINNNAQCSVALIKKMPGIEVTEMEIKQLVIEKYKYTYQLRRVVFIPIWPCHSNGKINRRCLFNMARAKLFWKDI